jgi:hypothetical protein
MVHAETRRRGDYCWRGSALLQFASHEDEKARRSSGVLCFFVPLCEKIYQHYASARSYSLRVSASPREQKIGPDN